MHNMVIPWGWLSIKVLYLKMDELSILIFYSNITKNAKYGGRYMRYIIKVVCHGGESRREIRMWGEESVLTNSMREEERKRCGNNSISVSKGCEGIFIQTAFIPPEIKSGVCKPFNCILSCVPIFSTAINIANSPIQCGAIFLSQHILQVLGIEFS